MPSSWSGGRLARRTGEDARLSMINQQTQQKISKRNDGGRYRIRTYDFHRVKMALYR
jgi:hypothetical protein